MLSIQSYRSPLTLRFLPWRVKHGSANRRAAALPLSGRLLSTSREGMGGERAEERDGGDALHDGSSGGGMGGDGGFLKAWQAFGMSLHIPALVKAMVEEGIHSLRSEHGHRLGYGGQCEVQDLLKVGEVKRHRLLYKMLSSSEEKLQLFTARQVACRILGSKGYLCEHCWLPLQDCICSKIIRKILWSGLRIWVYMHPKDFLRKNNTGKLLWQVLGTVSTHLCIYGIREQEDAMWDCFKHAGHSLVWYVYPKRNPTDNYAHDISVPLEKTLLNEFYVEGKHPVINFVLIDGTWNNSKAMVSRLQEMACATWAGTYMACVSLSPEEPSAMHKLRPQPSFDRTCTASAAAQLLRELHLLRDKHGLDEAANAIDNALDHFRNVLVKKWRFYCPEHKE